MASERQIAANRRNARKSTGPRSCAGMKRASRNAYRHGLTPRSFSTVTRITRFLNAFYPGRVTLPKPIDASATMPSQEPERSAEAIRRVLPELRRLDRYERRLLRGETAQSSFLVE
jgi:hypothetical protein